MTEIEWVVRPDTKLPWGATPAHFVQAQELMEVFEKAAMEQYRRYHLHQVVQSLPTNAEVAEVLEKAADLLESEQVAWIQGVESRADAEGNVVSACVIGLLNLVTQAELNIYNHLYRAALDAVTRYLGTSVVAWNDLLGRTREEVIEMFKTVAKDLRNEQN